MAKLYRQGDVLLAEATIDVGEATRKESGDRVILAEGEVTGHSHSMPAASVTAYSFGGRDVIVVAEQALLTHPEHDAIEVAPGQYWVVRQREYAPGELRRVSD
jgi:hypothetical protein